jgi:protein-S-isoprenylcysteine O-methyltransferase Ste14
MRRSAAAAVSVAWGAALGGTFGCLLPYLLGEWHFHRPLPYWAVAQAAGVLLIGAGLVPIAAAFTDFIEAGGTPVPVAAPPRLVVRGFYRYVRNPIYAGFLAVLAGEALLFGSRGLLEYAALAWCGGALVRGTHPSPQVRGGLPGLPARRAGLDSPPASVDAGRSGRARCDRRPLRDHQRREGAHGPHHRGLPRPGGTLREDRLPLTQREGSPPRTGPGRLGRVPPAAARPGGVACAA